MKQTDRTVRQLSREHPRRSQLHLPKLHAHTAADNNSTSARTQQSNHRNENHNRSLTAQLLRNIRIRLSRRRHLQLLRRTRAEKNPKSHRRISLRDNRLLLRHSLPHNGIIRKAQTTEIRLQDIPLRIQRQRHETRRLPRKRKPTHTD